MSFRSIKSRSQCIITRPCTCLKHLAVTVARTCCDFIVCTGRTTSAAGRRVSELYRRQPALLVSDLGHASRLTTQQLQRHFTQNMNVCCFTGFCLYLRPAYTGLPIPCYYASTLCFLTRALQALSDLYCRSTCLSMCLSVRNFDAKYLGN